MSGGFAALKGMEGQAGRVLLAGRTDLGMEWMLPDTCTLSLCANLSAARRPLRDMAAASPGGTSYQTSEHAGEQSGVPSCLVGCVQVRGQACRIELMT